MCEYCDINDPFCEIFQEYPFTDNDWFLKVQTIHWDNYDDDWEYEQININYCPYCGRKLNKNMPEGSTL